MKIYVVTVLFLILNLLAIAKSVTITIPSGSTAVQIAHTLHDHALIQSPLLFRLYLKIRRAESSLHSGQFTLPSTASYGEILDILQEIDGPSSIVTIRIPEGFHIDEVASRFSVNPDQFRHYVRTQAKIDFMDQFSFIRHIPQSSLEGYLFPDTYLIASGLSIQSIVKMMLQQFEQQIYSIWLQSPHKTRSFHDIATLASIIEKEAATVSEMSNISAVFHNRLNQRMPLSSCPTVAYALGEPRKPYLSYADTRVDSPYNTYLHRGLPPTPIAVFGVAAFKAALNPTPSFNYLYFIARGDGTHIFSRTLRDHLNHQKRLMGIHR